ncbi:MAG: 16S rRNA (cytidine(1402)-2'-O)-methyltransferase [Acidobacteria bacterium]|nr:16S rRNA (cytidine(1402)-2'-O)-methyltransferase [Acidobacteriota bacterium]
MSPALYLIGTPIGNLEDITLRAIRILRDEVDRIACEDTRHSRKLLDHLGISKPLVSYHDHNEKDRSLELLDALRGGERIALISDAGTPLISDPGFRLVAAAVAEGIPVIPIPGPSAILTALCASGLPAGAFVFGGFLPPKSSQRRKALEAWSQAEATLVFHEAPHRILETLEDILAVLGDRPVVVAREMTKLHEQFLRGSASQVAESLRQTAPRGEITLLVGRPSAPSPATRTVVEAVDDAIAAGLDRMEAIKYVAQLRGVPKRDVYAAVEASRSGLR